MAQGDLVQRMLGAAMLNVDTFEEVEADEKATMQAAAVVAMVAGAAVVGGVVDGGSSLFLAPLSRIVGWLVWAGVTYLIGAKFLGGTATWGELLRTLGFAQAPGVLYLFAVIPFLGWIISLVVWIWILVAGVIAIRQALDFSTQKALLTGFLGWLALAIPGFLFS